MHQILNGERIILGTCYYPEHWEREDWEQDLTRMLEHGIEVIRVAEFAWNIVEPREGEYSFEYWDEFLDVALKCGMKVIFGTPTATPPAWLTDCYPEVLNVDIDGQIYYHGERRHYNYNSAKYQDFCKNIVEKLAAHYAKHPAIIGWQIDNELNCGIAEFYSESDTYAFRNYLKDKYGTVENLNKAWGTVFWNQTYTAWREIYVPRKTVHNSSNPHLVLDYIRFVSDSTCRFAKMQADIIRKYKKPDDFITTNGTFGNLDSHKMTRESLDFFTHDCYPNGAYALNGKGLSGLRDRNCSRKLANARSIYPIFGIMEQQSGAGSWTNRMESSSPRPGQMTLWSIQSIAHGADFISYFRWRTCTVGTEIYWHGLFDYSGRENRRTRELKNFHEKVKKLQEISGSTYKAKIGVLQDYDNQWDSQLDAWHQRVELVSRDGIFEAAQLTHTPFDYINLCESTTLESLEKYELLFYPHATILTEERMNLLQAYVERGGKLVMGCRTGYKDLNGKCVRNKLPGLAAELTGTDVLEYSFAAPDEPAAHVNWDGTEIEATVFYDMLAPLNGKAKILGSYVGGIFDGEPALIENSVGKGTAYYYGAAFDEETAKLFLNKLGVSEPYGKLLSLPRDCELAVRKKGDTEYLFILNYSSQAVTINVKERMENIYIGECWEGECELEGYGVAVLKFKDVRA